MQKVYILGTKHFIKGALKSLSKKPFLVSTTDNIELFKFQLSQLQPGESIIILDEDKIFHNTIIQRIFHKKNLLDLDFIRQCHAFNKNISSSVTIYDYEDIPSHLHINQANQEHVSFDDIAQPFNTPELNISDIEQKLMHQEDVFDIPNLIAIASGEIEDPADEEFDLESIIREMNQGSKKTPKKEINTPKVISQSFDDDDIEAIIAQSNIEKATQKNHDNLSLEDIINQTIEEELLSDESNEMEYIEPKPLIAKQNQTKNAPIDELSKTLQQLSSTGKINISFSGNAQDNSELNDIISSQSDVIEELKKKIMELSGTLSEYTPMTGSNDANDDIAELIRKAERAKRLSIDLTSADHKLKGPEHQQDEPALILEETTVHSNNPAINETTTPQNIDENTETIDEPEFLDITEQNNESKKKNSAKQNKTLGQTLLENLSEDDIFKMIQEGKF